MVNKRFLAACALAAPFTCLAQSQVSDQYFDNRWYITPFGTFINPDSARVTIDDKGWGGGFAIGKAISPYWNIELRTQYEEIESNWLSAGGDGKFKNWSATLDAQWFFLGRKGIDAWQIGSIQPYLVGGIGAMNDKYTWNGLEADNTSFIANAGLGVVWPFASWGRLTADARYRYNDNKRGFVTNQGQLDEWQFSVGLQIPFGPAPTVAPPPRPPAPPAPPPPPPPPAPPRTFDISADGTFEFDKAVLTSMGRSRIDDMLRQIGATGGKVQSISIVGYTDPLGSTLYNQRLSTARANAVRNALVGRGVPAGLIRTEGRGESDLKVTESDCRAQGARGRRALIECLQPNRRVEVRVTGQKTGR